MAITVKLPTQLRDAAGGAASVAGRGRRPSARRSSRVFAEHGELRERLYDEDGDLRRFVNVYLGGEDIRFLDGPRDRRPDGGELHDPAGGRRRLSGDRVRQSRKLARASRSRWRSAAARWRSVASRLAR